MIQMNTNDTNDDAAAAADDDDEEEEEEEISCDVLWIHHVT